MPPTCHGPAQLCVYCHKVWRGKTRMAWLPDGEKMLKICLFVLTECTNVMDGRTDGRTGTAWRHRPRLCFASRSKNCAADICYCPWTCFSGTRCHCSCTSYSTNVIAGLAVKYRTRNWDVRRSVLTRFTASHLQQVDSLFVFRAT